MLAIDPERQGATVRAGIPTLQSEGRNIIVPSGTNTQNVGSLGLAVFGVKATSTGGWIDGRISLYKPPSVRLEGYYHINKSVTSNHKTSLSVKL